MKAACNVLVLLLLSLQAFPQNNLIIETNCLKRSIAQSPGLSSLIQRLQNTNSSITTAYDSMRLYYSNNNMPADCSFTIVCSNCGDDGLIHYPIKTHVHSEDGNQLFAGRSGYKGKKDIDKLFSNELNIIKEALVDISPLLVESSYDELFIEYNYDGKTVSKKLMLNDKKEILLTKTALYDNLPEDEIKKLDNKLYAISGGVKEYLSPITFQLYFFKDDERENLKNVVVKYEKAFPGANADDIVKNLVNVISVTSGPVLYNDIEKWYQSL